MSRNNTLLFQGVSYALASGQVLSVRGANGIGKSTLLRILAGFIEPQQGSVSYDNQVIFQDVAAYQHGIHYLGHDNGVRQYLTVYENLTFYAVLNDRVLSTSQCNEVIQRVGLWAFRDTQALCLSAGQLRRLSLAKLLLRPAPFWILDEPTTALDDQGQQILADLINQQLQQNGMVVMATHQDIALTSKPNVLRLGS